MEGKEGVGEGQWGKEGSKSVISRTASFDYFRNRLIDTNNRL